MHFVGILDIVATLGFVIATVLALRVPRGTFGYTPRILLVASMAIYALVGVSNTLEHLDITDRFDKYEDYFEILFIPVFLFAVFSLRTEAAFTDRNRAEKELRESEERFRTLIERAGDALFLVDSGGKIVDVNREACDALRYKRDELLKLSVHDIDTLYTAEKFRQFAHNLDQSETVTIESVHQRQDKTTFPVEIRIGWIEIKGKPHLLSLIRDITERKLADREREQLESQLRQSQKMEAVGQLAGGVAHDFNNLLTVILGNTTIALRAARREPPQIDKLDNLLGQIHTAGERGASLIRQLLTFSRKQFPDPRPLDLNELIDGTGKMFRRLIGEHIEVHTTLAHDIDRIRADRGQIEQVILNLALNARDAMPKGGRLTIETANITLDKTYVSRHIEAQTGPHVMVLVKDTGQGITPQVLEHIFEPFFTTKPMDKGTGLGLAVVYGIVNHVGGHVTVESTPDQGTTFRLYFPSHVEPVERGTEEAPPTAVSGGHETILLCEDEDIVREFAQQCLIEAGYSVLAARDGKHALQLAAEYEGHIHLLATDLIMPEMDGNKLAHLLRHGYPNLDVLYMSGHTSDLIDQMDAEHEGTDLIRKPFEIDDFMRKVRELLDRRST